MNVSVFWGVNNCKVLGQKIFITSSGTTYFVKIVRKSVYYTFRKFTICVLQKFIHPLRYQYSFVKKREL